VAAAHRRVEDVERENGLDPLLVALRPLDCLAQHGIHGRLDDVLDDVVRGVVAARRLALAAVVQECNRPAFLGFIQGFEVVFEETLVDRTEVPLGQVAVVHELPVDAGEPVYGPLEVPVAYGVTLEKGVAFRIEEAAVEGRDPQGRAALGDDPEQFSEARPERGARRQQGAPALQVPLHVVLYGVEAVGVAVVRGLVDG
jgi:hypothetical protein